MNRSNGCILVSSGRSSGPRPPGVRRASASEYRQLSSGTHALHPRLDPSGKGCRPSSSPPSRAWCPTNFVLLYATVDAASALRLLLALLAAGPPEQGDTEGNEERRAPKTEDRRLAGGGYRPSSQDREQVGPQGASQRR